MSTGTTGRVEWELVHPCTFCGALRGHYVSCPKFQPGDAWYVDGRSDEQKLAQQLVDALQEIADLKAQIAALEMRVKALEAERTP